MSQLYIQCPNCRVNHPVAALPPAGTGLRCNACGHAFYTGQPAAPAPLASRPDPFGQRDPFGQAMAFPHDPFASRPQGRDPLRAPLSGRVLEPRREEVEGEWWKWAVGGALVIVALLVLVIGVSMLMRPNTTTAVPPVAATQSTAPTPAPVSTAVPAPTVAMPAAVPTPVAQSAPPTYGATPAPIPAAAPTTTTYRPASAVPASSAVEEIRQLKTVGTKPQFTYSWKTGEKYRYGFESRTNGSEGTGGRIGTVEYEVTTFPEEAGAEQQASGTAFVVHSDGLLMTCHHVVAGASSLKVHLKGQVYPADVVALDEPNDLAIIRIQATGLTALPLANSDTVQLAEEVKAIGFPLSDVLGRNVKITSGSISGMSDDPTNPRLQADITINPGNSGGPLVNNRGEVVGVNSAGLFGSSIQEVSFAVPSNEGRKLLRSIGVDGNGPPGSQRLEGPALASKVTPGTAFVEVELGEDSAVLLQFTGSARSVGSSILPSQQITSRIAAAVDGEVLGAQEDLPLGFGLSTFGTMVLEKLPSDGKKTWEEKRVTPLSMAGGGSRGQQVISLLLEEKINYELKAADDKQIVITKKMSVNTVGQSSMGAVKVTGEGTWTFDRAAGVPHKMEMTVDSYVSLAGKTTSFKGTTRYERLSGSNPSPWQANLEKEIAAAVSATPDDSGLPDLPELPPLSLEPSSDAQVIAALRILKGKKKTVVDYIEPLELLARMKPIEKKRTDVSNTLHNIRTTMSDHMLPWILAARVWGTEKNIPTLLYVLDAPTSDSGERMMALETLGRLPATKDSAKVVARWVDDPRLGVVAFQSLAAMGSAAEDAIADLLKSSNDGVRILACVMLAKNGTQKSVAALESYLRGETDPRCRAAGNAALQELRKRAGERKGG